MKCTVQLAPDGALQFRTPQGRLLTVPFDKARTEEPWPDPDNELAAIWRKRAQTAEAAFDLLYRMLSHGEEYEHKPTSYPTQHVIDALARGKKINWGEREPVVTRTVLETLPKRKPKPKATLRAFGHEKKSGVDLSKVTFQL